MRVLFLGSCFQSVWTPMSAHDADQHTVASGEKQDKTPSQMELGTVEVESVQGMVQLPPNRSRVRRAHESTAKYWKAARVTSRQTTKSQWDRVIDWEQYRGVSTQVGVYESTEGCVWSLSAGLWLNP